jgi:hypothetical protein
MRLCATPGDDRLLRLDLTLQFSPGFPQRTLFDNRTGRMTDNGYINCYEVVSQLLEEEKNAVTPSKLFT